MLDLNNNSEWYSWSEIVSTVYRNCTADSETSIADNDFRVILSSGLSLYHQIQSAGCP